MDKYTLLRACVKNIVLAQTASDAGKGIYLLNFGGCKEAQVKGYAIKEKYVNKAISIINNSPRLGVNYYVEEAPDQNGYKSIISYFDIKLEGERYQVSFHSPYGSANSATKSNVGKGRSTRWDCNIGGSRKTCEKLIKLFEL